MIAHSRRTVVYSCRCLPPQMCNLLPLTGEPAAEPDANIVIDATRTAFFRRRLFSTTLQVAGYLQF